MNNWKEIKLDEVDLSLIDVSSNIKTRIKKFFKLAQTEGLYNWNDENEIYKIKCYTLGDLSEIRFSGWLSGANFGKKTIHPIQILINRLAKEKIFDDRDLGITKSLEERKFKVRERWKEVYEMHESGISWKSIANKFIISEYTAKQMAAKYRKENKIPIKKYFEWQPIETAPKDGLYDILVSEGLGVYMATWSRLGPLPNTKFGWVTNTGFQIEPTHWMPLPEPPK